MTMLLYDSIFLEHETGGHPESTERLQTVWSHLQDMEGNQWCPSTPWRLATTEQLRRVHELGYVRAVEQFAERGGGRIEADTMVSPLSYHVALQASGAVCHAVEQVVSGSQPNALCLVRPPGHHARPAGAMGFCLFNHIAVGARHAIDALGLERVLIVDWDVHHGNGTQESFYADEQVGFLSIHRFPFYPGTGAADETGQGAALGTTTNVAVEFGTSRAVYLAAFRVALEDLAHKMQPDLVMISAGFDAHRRDPIGSLGLEVEDFAELTRFVRTVADQYCGGRIVSMLEGGYNPGVLPQCVDVHLQGLRAA